MKRSQSEPLWQRTSTEPPPSDVAFASGRRVDVAVVGGGFTGLSTALHGAMRGLDVQLVEAGGLAHGGSGRNVGLVNAGVWLPPERVEQALGPDLGPRFVAFMGQGPQAVFALAERWGIDCEITRTGTIHAAHARSGVADLRARHAQWRQRGAPVDLLGAEEMARLTGTRHFPGGLLDRRAGTLNPAAYARGLARAALSLGARIATGVRAVRLGRDGSGWRLETTAGPVRARSVVLATNAYADGLWPGLARCHVPIRYFQLATEPLGAEADHVLPGRQGLWDTAPVMFDLRRDRAGRLLIGAMGRLRGTVRSGLSQAWARRQIRALFPALGPVRFEAAWDGVIAFTLDHLPCIRRLAPGVWAPTAYNGRGITTGTLFGALTVDLILGAEAGGLPVPVAEGLVPVPGRRLRAAAYESAFVAARLWETAWPRRRMSAPAGRAQEDRGRETG